MLYLVSLVLCFHPLSLVMLPFSSFLLFFPLQFLFLFSSLFFSKQPGSIFQMECFSFLFPTFSPSSFSLLFSLIYFSLLIRVFPLVSTLIPSQSPIFTQANGLSPPPYGSILVSLLTLHFLSLLYTHITSIPLAFLPSILLHLLRASLSTSTE